MFENKNLALARALGRRSAAMQMASPPVALPPPLPPAPTGMMRFQDVLREILFSAFGEGVVESINYSENRANRLRAALQNHDAKERERAAQTRAARLGGLLGLGFVSLEKTSAEERAEAKIARVRDHLRRLDAIANARRSAFFDAWSRTRDFTRALAVQGALAGSETVDASGRRRPVQTKAWGDPRNWERLMLERMFEAGDEPLADPGMPCLPLTTANALIAFVKERGEAALGDIPGALRAFGATPIDPPKTWDSAVEWFLAEGQKEIRANLTERKALTEGAVCREAARRWNQMPATQKSPKAKPFVRDDAFKKANTRVPKGGTRGTV
jgi:hypothetical protein